MVDGQGMSGKDPDPHQSSPSLDGKYIFAEVQFRFVTMSQGQMQSPIEQHYAIKFCVKISKSGPEMVEMVSAAYKENALSHAQIYWW